MIRVNITRKDGALFSGVFDTEGDVSIKKGKSYIGISQKNEEFLEELQMILKELDIKTGNIHVIDKKSNTLRFVVASKKDMIKFISLIPSIHPIKSTSLASLKEFLEQ